MEVDPENQPSARSALSPRANKSDPKQSLQHILTTSEPLVKSKHRLEDQLNPSEPVKPETPSKQPIIWIDGDSGQVDEKDKDEPASVQNDSYTRAAEFNPSHTMTVAHTRRNANGTIGSVYSGNKIRHLKKEDGIPLWRKDIQLNFLECVFEDDAAVFTKAYDGTPGHTFADIYVDAMARSSKTSKILKEKLLADRGAAMHMAMVCLLVNVGRMNTTLNCMLSLPSLIEDCLQGSKSFLKCALSCGHTIQYLHCKPIKIPMHTNSFKMLPASNPSSKALLRTRISQVQLIRSKRSLFLVPIL